MVVPVRLKFFVSCKVIKGSDRMEEIKRQKKQKGYKCLHKLS